MPKSLNQWLSYIETIHTTWMDLGLDRILKVANKLNLIPFNKPVITVAGTNGKGSTVAILEAILIEQGFNVGSYTSPHLLEFNERIRVNGINCNDDIICEAFSQIETARGDISLTYFEFATLAALLIYYHQPLDIIILEVGMGGRLDAVNIIDADVAVITSISLDHQQWLGQTRDIIALEKAGITRSNKPVVCGDLNPPYSLVNYFQENQLNAAFIQKDFYYQVENQVWHWSNQTTRIENLPIPKLMIQNTATAIAVLKYLPNKFKIDDDVIKTALKKVSLFARQEYYALPKPTLIDVAHNAEAIQLLAEKVSRMNIKGKCYAVFSMLADKDIPHCIAEIKNLITHWFIAPIANPRAADMDIIQNALEQEQLKFNRFIALDNAYDAACEIANEHDLIVVFGSFHTAAKILNSLCNSIEKTV